MNITINYFGMLTDATGCATETITFYGNTVKQLLDELYKKYPKLATNDFQVAQNQTLVTTEEPLTGEKIALLPPFSGG